ncbi:MAG: methyl-accepting chemotaxis protein [Burkholderiaceae bacterium]
MNLQNTLNLGALTPAMAGDGHSRGFRDSVADLPLPGLTAALALQRGGPDSTQAVPTSIIAEPAASELPDFGDSHVPDGDAAPAIQGSVLPIIGRRPVAAQRRILSALLLLGAAGVLGVGAAALMGSARATAQLASHGNAMEQAQRLAKSVPLALFGAAGAFGDIRDSSTTLAREVQALKDGGEGVAPAPSSVQADLDPIVAMVGRAQAHAQTLLKQEKTLVQANQAMRLVSRDAADLLQGIDAVQSAKLQQQASSAEIAALGRLAMLSQRLGKSANEVIGPDGIDRGAAEALRKDLASFRDLTVALRDGNPELRLPGTRDAATRERLDALITLFETSRSQGATALATTSQLVAAQDAEAAILAESDALVKSLDTVGDEIARSGNLGSARIGILLGGLVLLSLGGLGLVQLFVGAQAQRAAAAQEQQREAERQEREAKRVNDANQAAILRLMNELQLVAEGDLTQQATVTEDITGAIADSVNYTVEELRTLVAQVQGTVGRVTDTTQQVESTSTELLAASSEQLREIRDTGESVLQMAGRINQVSGKAQESAEVARQSLGAAASGLRAVQDTIGGMNSIRDQIQDTSKRIKRLGESSQEIGEITELISDITEQTNVLALNAAIQAASAGEAGRGFSVVAEEVQRLAERSGDATRQIAALVKTIQTDTQDAVGAMERSTQGVVEGTRLSDAAGTALGEIDRVSRRLAELIEQISSEALKEAASANVVAENIQHIFAVTEQTGDGTRSTARMVRELSRTADDLKQSVARFKIA